MDLIYYSYSCRSGEAEINKFFQDLSVSEGLKLSFDPFFRPSEFISPCYGRRPEGSRASRCRHRTRCRWCCSQNSQLRHWPSNLDFPRSQQLVYSRSRGTAPNGSGQCPRNWFKKVPKSSPRERHNFHQTPFQSHAKRTYAADSLHLRRAAWSYCQREQSQR